MDQNEPCYDHPKLIRLGTPLGRLFGACLLLIVLSSLGLAEDEFQSNVQPMLKQFCVTCHSGDFPEGEVSFESLESQQDIEQHYDVWAKAVELIAAGQMPPEDEPQPTQAQRLQLKTWYQAKFVDNVQVRAGNFRPRRLCATEYRNTLRSLFGFELEIAIAEAEQTRTNKSLVMKLLPTDPPGRSGFCNDTHSNPLTTVIWDQYSYLVDRALDELFSQHRRPQLAALLGSSDAGDSDIEASLNGRLSSPFTLTEAESLVRNFVPRAQRRPVPENKLNQIVEAIRSSDDIVGATKTELKVVLMSPTFLYRGLLMGGEPDQQQAVDDFELAERLSYFLWADMPDPELLRLAEEGTLGQSEVLKSQVQRMLDSPRAINLAQDFAVQWLALEDIEQVSDEAPYVLALKSQPIDFVNYLFKDDRPLLELIDSNIAFVNLHTKKFYPGDSQQLAPYRKRQGIEVEAMPNQRITLINTTERGGLLTMPGIVAMNRGAVIRGTWVLERILGEHLPDPPANVGQVAPNQGGENLTFRQRFEQHRSNSSCAVCHDKIDPIGFALQAYDQAGSYVLSKGYLPPKKRKGQDISAADDAEMLDASGQLPTGEQFDDFEGLKQILVTTQAERVKRNIVTRLLSYALCRKLEYYDKPTVDAILRRLDATQGTYRELVFEIANSLPFRQTYIPGVTL